MRKKKFYNKPKNIYKWSFNYVDHRLMRKSGLSLYTVNSHWGFFCKTIKENTIYKENYDLKKSNLGAERGRNSVISINSRVGKFYRVRWYSWKGKDCVVRFFLSQKTKKCIMWKFLSRVIPEQEVVKWSWSRRKSKSNFTT